MWIDFPIAKAWSSGLGLGRDVIVCETAGHVLMFLYLKLQIQIPQFRCMVSCKFCDFIMIDISYNISYYLMSYMNIICRFTHSSLALPASIIFARHGVLGHLDCYGFADLERKAPAIPATLEGPVWCAAVQVEMRPDSIVRLYSMTKCVVSVALGVCLEAKHLLNRVELKMNASKYGVAQKHTTVTQTFD